MIALNNLEVKQNYDQLAQNKTLKTSYFYILTIIEIIIKSELQLLFPHKKLFIKHFSV